jgi:hypothetical protein
MMVSHDSLAGLADLFLPPGLPVQWLSDRFNRATAASFDVVVCHDQALRLSAAADLGETAPRWRTMVL